jgi:L-lactate dehydrogenase (cytochrome)
MLGHDDACKNIFRHRQVVADLLTGSVDEALADRAAAAQRPVLTLTVDTQRTGNRPRDTRNGFRTPFRMGLRHFIDFAVHPRWSLGTLAAGAPRMVHFDGLRPGGYDRTAPRRGANWDFLARLRERWPRRLVVKGVLNPDDARRLGAGGGWGVGAGDVKPANGSYGSGLI